MKKRIVWIWAKQVLIIVVLVGCLVGIRWWLSSPPKSDPGLPQEHYWDGIEMSQYLRPAEYIVLEDFIDDRETFANRPLLIETTPEGARATLQVGVFSWYIGVTPTKVRLSAPDVVATIEVVLAGHKTRRIPVHTWDQAYNRPVHIRLEPDIEAVERVAKGITSVDESKEYAVSYSETAKIIEVVGPSNEGRWSFAKVQTAPETSKRSIAFVQSWEVYGDEMHIPAFAYFRANGFALTVVGNATTESLLYPLGRFGLCRTGNTVAMYDLVFSQILWKTTVAGSFEPYRVEDTLVLKFPYHVQALDAFSGQLVWESGLKSPPLSETSVATTGKTETLDF